MGLANATRGGSRSSYSLRSEMQRHDVTSHGKTLLRPAPRRMGEGRTLRVGARTSKCGLKIILVTHSRQSLGILNVLVSSRRSRLATLILPQHTSISRLVRFAKPERSSPCRRSLLSTSIAHTPNSMQVLRPRVSPPRTSS